MTPLIALLTDFGTNDIYVGVMKAVIQQICPAARCIDLTHAISPQNVRQGAFALFNAYPFFSPGTVFLIVIDPGVGSTRRPIAVQAGEYLFVAPDNGILTYVLSELAPEKVVVLENMDYQLPDRSRTFHGRDIFAPAAAHLAAGVPLERFGAAAGDLFTLPAPTLTVAKGQIEGEVMHIDRFGNIITSIGKLAWIHDDSLMLRPRFGSFSGLVHITADRAAVTIADQELHTIQPSYSETARGEFVALVDSSGYLEIAVNQGNAAARLDVQVGDPVILQK